MPTSSTGCYALAALAGVTFLVLAGPPPRWPGLGQGLREALAPGMPAGQLLAGVVIGISTLLMGRWGRVMWRDWRAGRARAAATRRARPADPLGLDSEAQADEVCSLAEDIDTTTLAGRLVFHVFASIAQFERERIAERTREGLQSAKARGRVGWPPLCPDRCPKGRGAPHAR